MVNELIEAGKTDILWIGYYLASRVFTDDGDLQWLKGRFSMLNDFLWDSPIYQEFVGEIRAEAKAEEMAELLSPKQQELNAQLLNLVDARFSTL